MRGRWRFLQPTCLANRDRDVSHGRRLARPVPVLLAGISRHRIALIDALRSVSAGLDPALTVDDVQQLSACVRMPVVSSAGLELNNRGKYRGRLRRSLNQLSRNCIACEMRRIHWVLNVECL